MSWSEKKSIVFGRSKLDFKRYKGVVGAQCLKPRVGVERNKGPNLIPRAGF